MKMNRAALGTVVGLTIIVAVATAATFGPNEPPAGRTLASCVPGLESRPWTVPAVFSASGHAALEDVLREASEARAVFIGEVHTRAEHHRAQLELICNLYRSGADLAIGVEFFQQPFQAYLDEYVAGRLEEKDLVRLTDYDRRWGYDFELYTPILRFARDNGIPVIALNVPRELTKAVARRGLAGLTEAERAFVPARMDKTNADYVNRLKVVFDAHPKGAQARFEHFLEAQLLWDEGMAESAAGYLSKRPDKKLVVLAGNGHVAWRAGIPGRLTRRIDARTVVVSQANAPISGGADEADFILVHGAPQAFTVAAPAR